MRNLAITTVASKLANRLAPASSNRRDLLRHIDKLEELVGLLWVHSEKYEQAKETIQVLEGVMVKQNARISELIDEVGVAENRLMNARYRISSLENQRQYLTGRVV